MPISCAYICGRMGYDFCEISSIDKLCSLSSPFPFNIAGINEAILFPEQYILSTPSYNFVFDQNKAAQLSGSIVLKQGAEGYRFRFTTETGSFSEKMQENGDGVFYDQLFSINIPKDRPEITWLKYRMSRSRYTALIRDANGHTKIIRNLRVKFDMDSGKSNTDYNGHTMYARKAATIPALHWNLSSTLALESLFSESLISFDNHYIKFDNGWQPTQKIELPNTPISIEGIYAVYNNTMVLQPGTDFTLNGKTITLSFDDEPLATNSAGEFTFFYACNRIGQGISTFHQETIQKTTTYTSGETITLSNTPADIDHINIRLNQSVTLRPGVDFSLSGNTITLNFGDTPTVSSPDTFHILYIETGTDDVGGWKYYSHNSTSGLVANNTVSLPHTPVANSLLVRYDGALQLIPGTDFNLINNNEVQLLFDTDANSKLEFWYAY